MNLKITRRADTTEHASGQAVVGRRRLTVRAKILAGVLGALVTSAVLALFPSSAGAATGSFDAQVICGMEWFGSADIKAPAPAVAAAVNPGVNGYYELVFYRASLLRYDPVRGWQVRQQTPTFVTAAYPYVAGFYDSGWYNTTTGVRASLINHFVISTPADAAHRQYYAVQYDISWAATKYNPSGGAVHYIAPTVSSIGPVGGFNSTMCQYPLF